MKHSANSRIGRNPRVDRTQAGAQALPPDTELSLMIYLRHRRPVRRRPGSRADLAELSVRMKRSELAMERRQRLREPIREIRKLAAQAGMRLQDVDLVRRTARLETHAVKAERLFSTRLVRTGEGGAPSAFYPTHPPRLPRPWGKLIHAVLGLDQRPLGMTGLRPDMTVSEGTGLFPSRIGALYGLTDAGNGAGQTIALIEPAGGYSLADVVSACAAMAVATPEIVDISVGSGRNAPGTNARADREVALDLQVLAGIAPAARIAIYFTDLSETGLVAGLSEAVHGDMHPSVIVMTWGEPEVLWPAQARAALDAVLQDALRLGITVVTASGDDLATDRMGGARVSVDYPASSPYTLGCGGTQITLDEQGEAIAAEVAWNDGKNAGTGGGVSELYALPDFQRTAGVPGSLNDGKPGRGVPDVCAAAAFVNGYRVIMSETEFTASGTSAAAPLWGAYFAVLNSRRGSPLGFVNPILYRNPGWLRDIVSGDNVESGSGLGYSAGEGWDACTGLGSPDGKAITSFLGGS